MPSEETFTWSQMLSSQNNSNPVPPNQARPVCTSFPPLLPTHYIRQGKVKKKLTYLTQSPLSCFQDLPIAKVSISLSERLLEYVPLSPTCDLSSVSCLPTHSNIQRLETWACQNRRRRSKIDRSSSDAWKTPLAGPNRTTGRCSPQRRAFSKC